MIARTCAAVLFAISAGGALAEGAVEILDCTVVTRCDGVGTCASDGGNVTFTVTPTAASDGTWSGTIGYDGATFDLYRADPLAPWTWAVGERENNTILANGSNDMLWHTFTLTPDFVGTTRFLTCGAPR